MADYREISQHYARGAISAAILINGGAAVALVSQAVHLSGAGLSDAVMWAMISWAVGVALGAGAWVCGFVSTRLVDLSNDHERVGKADAASACLKTSNRWMFAGVVSILVSIVGFLVGCVIIAWNLNRLYAGVIGA